MAKRHHFVPVTYLQNFVGSDGFLVVYQKDGPDAPLKQKPRSIGFKRYYYSQTDGHGFRDDSTLETIFSQTETFWPEIVKSLECRRNIFPSAPQMISWLALMRVRGPAFRDAIEMRLSAQTLAELRFMDANGMLPEKPSGFEDILDHIEVTIDPQKSLQAMANVLPTLGEMFGELHYDVLHNDTGLSFLTSDNAVVYFNPDVPSRLMLPYTVQPGGPIEVLFPLTPKMLLRGRRRPVREDIGHRSISDRSKVGSFNRLIARFAYRLIFADQLNSTSIVIKSANVSPVVRVNEIPHPNSGIISLAQMVFGERQPKPKWKREKAQQRLSDSLSHISRISRIVG